MPTEQKVKVPGQHRGRPPYQRGVDGLLVIQIVAIAAQAILMKRRQMTGEKDCVKQTKKTKKKKTSTIATT